MREKEIFIYLNPDYSDGNKKHNKELVKQYGVGPFRVRQLRFNVLMEPHLICYNRGYSLVLILSTKRVLFKVEQPLEELL